MNKKLMLISTSSLLAVSPLITTISCNKTEENKTEEDVNATLTKAKEAFKLTPKTDKPITNVQASTITTENLKDYFTATPGADFGADKGFEYKLSSVKVNTEDATKLDVVYDISYKGKTEKWTTTIVGFEDVNATLTKAKEAFKLTQTDKPINDVEASTITTENLKDYFTATPGADFGADKGFEYKLSSVKVNTEDATKLDVVYDISYKGKTEKWTTTIADFKTPAQGGEASDGSTEEGSRVFGGEQGSQQQQ